MNSSANNSSFAAGNAPAISLRNISKSYRLWRGSVSSWAARLTQAMTGINGGSSRVAGDRDFLALRNISFEVAAGESLGIIGRNGCGKSTLLQILAGILKPTSGSGTVNGEIAALLELGTGFHPDFSGRENVVLNNALLGLSREAAAERSAQIEAFAELGRFMDEPIRTYSSGMLLRLGFACVVAVQPDVFLVDEGLAVGDIFFQQKCFEYLRERMSHTTRVIVSHDLHAITTFCSRVLVLDAGAMVFDGPPLAAVEYYMKALHDNQAGAVKNGAVNPAVASAAGRASPAAEWREVTEDSLGGLGEIKINRVEVKVDGVAFGSVTKPGAVVGVRMGIDCFATKTDVLFGYLVRDKLGNTVFGENSAGLAGGVVRVEPGEMEVAFEFVWPEIQPGDYFLTLGVGEGNDPVRHRIQCWAHNLHVFNAITPGRELHALFNNPLRAFAVTSRAVAETTEAIK